MMSTSLTGAPTLAMPPSAESSETVQSPDPGLPHTTGEQWPSLSQDSEAPTDLLEVTDELLQSVGLGTRVALDGDTPSEPEPTSTAGEEPAPAITAPRQFSETGLIRRVGAPGPSTSAALQAIRATGRGWRVAAGVALVAIVAIGGLWWKDWARRAPDDARPRVMAPPLVEAPPDEFVPFPGLAQRLHRAPDVTERLTPPRAVTTVKSSRAKAPSMAPKRAPASDPLDSWQ